MAMVKHAVATAGIGKAMEELLLREITVTHVLDCIADATKIRVVAELSDDVSSIMPYLNAVIGKASYGHEARILHFNLEHRMITLYPRVLTMAKADDEVDARRVMDWLRELVNDCHRRRGEIEPSYEYRPSVKPLDVYLLLPRENCKRCGEATCMAFAFRLLQGRGVVRECLLLSEEQFAKHRQALSALLGT